MDVDEVGNAIVTPLAEGIGIGVAREGAAALAEGFGLPVAVGINVGEAGAGEVVGVVQVLVVGDGVVVAFRVVDAVLGAELDVLDVIRIFKRAPGPFIVANVVQGLVALRVDQAHAAHEEIPIWRRLAHVLAEDHQVVASKFGVEHGVTVVGVGKSARAIELQLRLPGVAVVAGPIIPRAEEVRGHVFHRVEAKAIDLGFVNEPADRPHQVHPCVFLEITRIARDHVGGDCRAVEADEAEGGVVVIEFGVIRMTHEIQFGMRRAE